MECPNCKDGKMTILKRTRSKLIIKCASCGYEEESLYPAPYNNEDSWKEEK